MAEELAERHTLAAAVATELSAKGWPITTVREGWKGEATLELPTVSLYFLPSNFLELQLGHLKAERSYLRRIQFDAYMESEDRAIGIRDDIANYLDGLYLNIIDPLNLNVLGTMHVPDSQTISMHTLPPILTDPKIKRWRSIIQASLQADYF